MASVTLQYYNDQNEFKQKQFYATNNMPQAISFACKYVAKIAGQVYADHKILVIADNVVVKTFYGTKPVGVQSDWAFHPLH